MKKLLLVLCVLLLSGMSMAQSPQYPYSAAVITVAAPTTTPVDTVRFYCGNNENDLTLFTHEQDIASLSTPLTAFLPGPGVYICAATFTNIAGESMLSPLTAPFVLTPQIPAAPSVAPVITVAAP
jgi:hypothetical protein